MTARTTPETVLVLTGKLDITADRVVEKLRDRCVPVFRCDPADFPLHLALTATVGNGRWIGRLRSSHREVALGDIRSVYYRRPGRFRFPDDMPPPVRKFADDEARYGFGGVIAGLRCFWLNHPAKIADVEYKPLQLQYAIECGLRVPRSLITSDPAAVRSFVKEGTERVVYKSLTGANFVHNDSPVALYTDFISLEDASSPRIGRTAHLFQDWVPKAHDVRLTVVRDEFFAVLIDVQGSKSGFIDWRRDYASHRYELIETPAEVKAGVRALLARLGLSFGALDFVVTPAGYWVFLEINPNGQWGWIEAATGLNISSAIADALEQGLAE